eukprot:NP_497522.2 Uncharacterized protein CELE_T20H9.6 [Caenorhabditis elegans]
MRSFITNKSPQLSRFMFIGLLCIFIAGYAESTDLSLDSGLDGSTRNELTNESLKIRARRATDAEFSIMLDRIQMISRIATGIHLRHGITKGTIDSEELISEFLNFGTTTPAQITAISVDKLKGIVDGINRLRELNVDDKMKQLEDRVTLYSSFVEKTKGMESANIFSNKDEYEAQLKQFQEKAQTLNLHQLESYFYTNIDIFMASLNILEATDNEKEADEDFREVIRLIKELNRSYPDYNPLFEFEKLNNPQNSFPLLYPVYETIQEYSKISETLETTILSGIQKNIDNVIKIAKSAKLNAESVEQLSNMLLSRHSKSTKASKHITGFFNGDSDIWNIFDNLKTDWINKTVYGQAEHIGKALQTLKTVQTNVQDSNESIRRGENDMLKEITDVHSKVIRLVKYAETVEPFIGSIEAIDIPQVNKDVKISEMDIMESLLHNMTLLSSKISTLKELYKLMNTLKIEENQKNSFIKNSKNSAQIEVNSLSEFKDIGRNSQVIGTATRGILNMQKLMNATIDFQAFEDMKYLTKKEILELEKKMSSQDVRNLKSLAGIGGELRTVVNEVINFKNLLPAFSANLLDYGGVFIQATKIKGIAIDCPAFIASLEKLKNILASWFFSKLSIDQLDKIMISLEFHLDFSKFSKALNGSAESLQALEMHFAKYKDTLKKAKNGTASSFSQPQSGAGFMEKGSPYSYIGLSMIVFIIVCVILFVAWKVYDASSDDKKIEEKSKSHSSK